MKQEHPDNNQEITSSEKNTGKWMLLISWIIALSLLTAVFQNWEENQHNPNQIINSNIGSGNIIETTLLRNKWGHYVFNGGINGREVEFLIDTGASEVSIPEKIANKLGLESGAALQRYTANGVITVYASSIKKLDIGSIQLRDVFATINPHMQEDQVLLGMSALKEVEFTQTGDTLTLKQYR